LPLHDPSGPSLGRVRATAPALPYCDRPTPRDTDEARFSFPLNVAQAPLDGEVTPRSFEVGRLGRRELCELLWRIELTLCDSIPRDFSRSEVRIELENGRRASSDRWPGHWKSAAQDDQLRAKFVEWTSPRMDPATAAAPYDRLRSISAEPVAREALRIP
jgi:2-methylcitrate dehydratase PrpD